MSEKVNTLEHKAMIDSEKYEAFLKHKCSSRVKSTIGGRISYEYAPSSLFTEIKVKCRCGREEDITDYSNI